MGIGVHHEQVGDALVTRTVFCASMVWSVVEDGAKEKGALRVRALP